MVARFLPSMPASGRALTGAGGSATSLQPAGEARYPPCDTGLPVQPRGAIVAAQPELMAMLRLHAALEPALFERRFAEPIARVAEQVNVLPGSASADFAGSGGLFRAALATAVACFRASDGRIFTGALGVEARHLLEPRWRYLCFVAGLLFPLGRPLRQMTVVGAGGEAWSPELEGLTPWAARNGTIRIFISWTGDASDLGPGAVTATFALALLGRDNIEWLNRGSPALVHALLHIVTGRLPRGLVAASLVSEVWTAVRSREAARCQENWRRVTIGTQVLPYLLDAMVALARSDWLDEASNTLQADGSGLYLVWPQAGRDIIDFCRRQGTPGIPRTEPALLAMLVDGRLVEPGLEGTGLVMLTAAEGAGRLAVQVAQPELLLDAPGSEPTRSPKQQLPRQSAATDPVGSSTVAAPEAEKPEHAIDASATQSHQPSLAAELPPELVADLPTADAEILGSLVRRWREGPAAEAGIHRCPDGAAFELRLLSGLGPDPTAFLRRLADLGLLYVAPSTTGRLVYPWPRDDAAGNGRAGSSCFILTAQAMQRLGMS